MPQALPAIIGFATKTVVGKFLFAVVSTAAQGLLMRALSKRPGSQQVPINVTVRSTVTARRICFGTVRAGGAIVFMRTSGANSKYLWYVIAYAGHQCSALQDLWLDKYRIPAADINGSTGAVSTTDLDGKLKCWDHLGTQAQTADSNLTGEFASIWLSTHRLRGICYRVLRFERSDKAYPSGAPQNCSSKLQGALLYDPRLDTTNGGSGSHRRDDPQTWAFSNNLALVTRWYLSGGSVVNDQATRLIKYGVQETDARISDSYVIAAANICDQSLSGANAPPSGAQVRYTCDIEVSCDQIRREILEEILVCGAAQLVYLHGTWRLYVGAYDAPIHAFTQADLFGEPPLEVDDTVGDEDRFNTISAVFLDAGMEWNEQTTPLRSNAAYVTQDGGQTLTKEISLRGVTDKYRAQRVIERLLRDGRQMRTVVFRFGRQGMAIAPWETFTCTHERYGWTTSKIWRCLEREYEENETKGLIVKITAKAAPSSIDTDLVTADYTTGTSVTNALQSEPPDAPTGLTAVTRAGAIEFTWSLSAFWERNGIVELWEYTSSTPFASATRIWAGRGTKVTIEKTDQTARYYWVRIATIGGQLSSTEPASTGLAGVAYFAVVGTPVHDEPADGNIAYTAGTQPRVEAAGIGSHITYTSPAGVATRCLVNYAGQAAVSNTTSGVAVGYASIQVVVQVNGSTVWTRETRLEAKLQGSDDWGELSGSKSFDVPAGQAIDVFMNVGRTFSTGGSSPTQTIYWRAAHTEILPTKQT